MKIQRIETYTHDSLCIVRVCTDDGHVGIGQTAPYQADITATVLHRQVAPHVLGEEADDIERLVERCMDREHKFPGSYICRAVGGVDTALWDLRGKLADMSVCELIGGRPRPFPAYGSSMRRNIQPADEAERIVRLRDERGFRAFKIRIGKECGHDVDEWPGRTEALIPAVRAAIGDDTALLVNANSCYTPARAIAVGLLLQQHGVCHYEEPCPYRELEWTAEVTAALDVPVSGGEQDTCLAQWKRMIAMHAVDIVQPDICYVGGFSRALRVAAMAAEAGLPCIPHSANLSMVTVFSLHLLGAIPNAGPYVEFTIEPDGWTHDLFAPVLEVHDGHAAFPEGPGWGVTVNPAWLARADRQVSELA